MLTQPARGRYIYVSIYEPASNGAYFVGELNKVSRVAALRSIAIPIATC